MTPSTSTLTIATNNGDVAGGEVMLFALAEISRALGCAVTVVAPSHPGDVVAQARARGFRVIELRAESRRAYLRRLRTWDRTQRTGILWCNGLVPALATAGHPNRVIHVHQVPRNAFQWVALRLARAGNLLTLVPSRFLAVRILGSEILPNWVNEVRVSRPEPAPLVRLGYLGRLSEGKGVDILARALLLLEDREPGRYRLVLGGDHRSVKPEERDRIEQALRPVAHLIERRGWVSREEFFAMVDLAVFPSVWPESFGLVVAEAMSARVPFVVADSGSLPEVAGPEHPWVARAGDPEHLAAVIASASGTPNEASVERAFERWRDEFSPQAARRHVLHILTGLGVLDPGDD